MSKIDWDKIKVIVLDRDGVINHDSDEYIKTPEEWIPIAGSLPAIAALNKKFKVAIATNQSGIGRGYYGEQVLHDMHDKMDGLLKEYGGHIDHIEFCPHHPDDGCACRKPETQMLEHIADKFSAEPQEIVFIGDSSSDYHCAQNFGCSFVLLLTGKGLKTLNKLAGKDLIVEKSLAKLVERLVNQEINLIVGAGKLGHRFYDYLQSLEQPVITLSRSPKAWAKQHICYDLLQNQQHFPELPKLNTVFIILAPGERSESAYRQTYVEAVTSLLTHLRQQQTDFHCVFVSSTSVYAGNSETVINEQTPPQPDSFSGRILLEAEENVKKLHPNTSIVRPSGLYSSQRQRLIDSLLDKSQYDNPKWLNLVHEHDLCQWLWQAALNQWTLTIASDGFPFQRKQLQDFARSIKSEAISIPEQNNATKCYLSNYLDLITLRYPTIFHWLQLRM